MGEALRPFSAFKQHSVHQVACAPTPLNAAAQNAPRATSPRPQARARQAAHPQGRLVPHKVAGLPAGQRLADGLAHACARALAPWRGFADSSEGQPGMLGHVHWLTPPAVIAGCWPRVLPVPRFQVLPLHVPSGQNSVMRRYECKWVKRQYGTCRRCVRSVWGLCKVTAAMRFLPLCGTATSHHASRCAGGGWPQPAGGCIWFVDVDDGTLRCGSCCSWQGGRGRRPAVDQQPGSGQESRWVAAVATA